MINCFFFFLDFRRIETRESHVIRTMKSFELETPRNLKMEITLESLVVTVFNLFIFCSPYGNTRLYLDGRTLPDYRKYQ